MNSIYGRQSIIRFQKVQHKMAQIKAFLRHFMPLTRVKKDRKIKERIHFKTNLQSSMNNNKNTQKIFEQKLLVILAVYNARK